MQISNRCNHLFPGQPDSREEPLQLPAPPISLTLRHLLVAIAGSHEAVFSAACRGAAVAAVVVAVVVAAAMVEIVAVAMHFLYAGRASTPPLTQGESNRKSRHVRDGCAEGSYVSCACKNFTRKS